MLKLTLLAAAIAASCPAVELATGRMLGNDYQPRSFYVRENASAPWRPTYTGSEYRPEAAGRLMNLRIAQALFDDEWLTEASFDPEANTDRLIAALDTYKKHGILAVCVSLQGGNPGYNKEVPEIKRERSAKLGPGKGSLISAFQPDGALKPAWMNRLRRLQRALDSRSMILDLMYFYEGQDEMLRDSEAIRRAVGNATDWLVRNDCRNVIIEIANEHDIRGWDHDNWIPNHIGELIELARDRLKPNLRLPIGASTGGSMAVFAPTRDRADLTMIHGNGRTPEEKRRRVAELFADPKMPGPIYMNEDDNGRDTLPEVLARELASCDAVFSQGGSWGCMPWRQVQMFPFRHYMPADSPRDAAYLKAVLEDVRKLVFR